MAIEFFRTKPVLVEILPTKFTLVVPNACISLGKQFAEPRCKAALLKGQVATGHEPEAPAYCLLCKRFADAVTDEHK